MEIEKALNLLGTIKGVELAQHTYHLEVMGDYSDHLLLGEIYDSMDELYDSLAERFVCLYGKSSINQMKVLEEMSDAMRTLSENNADDTMIRACNASNFLLETYRDYFNFLEENWSKDIIGLANMVQDQIDMLEGQHYKLLARCCQLKD